MEKEKEENIERMKIFGQRRRYRMEKEEEEIFREGKYLVREGKAERRRERKRISWRRKGMTHRYTYRWCKR